MIFMIVSSPMFGIILCIFTYKIGIYINNKLKSPLANPLLISIILIILILRILQISLDSFKIGGDIISMFLGPATVSLALSVYRQLNILKKFFIPIVIGCFVGCITSIVSSYLLCKLFMLDNQLIFSMIPKSVTTPIAIEISSQLGGVVPVTIIVVLITGILGAIISPLLIKLFHIDNSIAIGVSIGTSSHAVGTSKAIQLGEIEGAMSGVAIGISGLITVILSLFI